MCCKQMQTNKWKFEWNVQNKLQNSVDAAANWYNNNKLVVNAKKSNTLLVVSDKKPKTDDRELLITLNDTPLEQVDKCNYLGIQIDKHLKWEDQINKLCRGLGFKAQQLKMVRKKCKSPDVLKYVYNTTVQPIIDYGITVRSTATKEDIERVQHHSCY